jgi:hypothetical protein
LAGVVVVPPYIRNPVGVGGDDDWNMPFPEKGEDFP